MRPKLAAIAALVLGTLLALALASSSAPAGDAPNQGDADKVLTVDNPNVTCEDAEPGKKVEGELRAKDSRLGGGPDRLRHREVG